SITDGDGSPVEAIAVTSVDADKGTWQFSTNGGTSWTNINAGTTNDNNALLLDSTDMLRFVPNADANGTETITFRAWDKSTGTAGTFDDADPNGGTTAFSSATDTASITVNPVNDAPTVATLPATVTVTEETASDVDLSAADFGDIDSATITVTLSIDAGTFSAPAVGAGVGGGVTATLVNSTTITLAGAPDDIDTYLDTTSNIQYTSETDADTADAATITVTANDGDGSGDVSLGTVSVDVTGVNDLPTSAGNSVSTAEDTARTFSASDFAFSDVDTGDTLASVRIDTLPTRGTLKLSGVAVTAGDVIAVADIGNLSYSPPSNATGATSFTYSVNDGTGFATSTATLSISISARNDAPTNLALSGDLTVTEEMAGAIIGTVSASDVDDTTLIYTVSDERFVITDANVLKLKAGESIDFETEETVTVTLTASDDQGASTSRDFTITVQDLNELPASDDDDTITGGATDDLVRSGGGRDRIDTGDGRDTIDGGDGNDDINGGGDDDFLVGGSGRDNVNGGSGNDLVYAGRFDDDNDTVSGSGGQDTLGGGVGDDLLDGDDNDDLLWGRGGNDTVDGGTGDDMLYNGEGNDTVFGGVGDDTLWAGADDDRLSGGEGNDTFIFGANSGNDTISDFSLTDDTLNVQYSGAGFETLADVQAAASDTTVGDNSGLLIDLGNGQSVFLIGLTTADLATMDIVL
ncbi:MAG: cadherin-like domain-containing protein, partial [Oceanospirillaceae bacterium]|nr:cadherin-like domain-containing protein [Oceanospirillaceae bacterium]